MGLREIPIHGGQPAEHLGRACVRFAEDALPMIPQGELALADGTLELDLCVSGERSFPGIAWRIGDKAYEAFFVRPHQVGNPDAVQYTPVFNNVFGWQLYHGKGHWAPVNFPIGRWFTLRVSFANNRGEAFLDGESTPALVFGGLRAPVAAGGIGILPGGEGVHFARLAYEAVAPTLVGAPPHVDERAPGTVPGWLVSNIVPENSPLSAAVNWTFLESEPSGLTDLARVNPLGNRLNTCFARTVVHSDRAGLRSVELGFSDRAVLFLNGKPLFAGRDDYRSRDYRFLGSIGYWDKIFLDLEAGDNELVVAVSETFGGWGLMARFPDFHGLTFPTTR